MPKGTREDSLARAGTIPDAVARLQALRAEHSPILSQIAGDAGMTAATRVVLLEHLRQEEDERLAQIAALASAGAQNTGGVLIPASRALTSTGSGLTPTGSGLTPAGGGLTVGSLRPARGTPPPPRGTVGSLQRR